MRMRKKPWAAEELRTNTHLVQNAEENRGKWKELFSNPNNPVHMEIGCGKGRFISQNALKNPNINYLGIEREETVIAMALRLLNGEPNNNVFLLGEDIEDVLGFFEQGEIERIYINFCDPWPRKKWAKRRLTYRSFLERYKLLFGDTGEIFFKTDNRDLFEFSLNEFVADKQWQLSNISLNLHESDFEGNIMTEYEEKFSSSGMPIYRLEAKYTK